MVILVWNLRFKIEVIPVYLQFLPNRKFVDRKVEKNRRHPKLEYNARLIGFVMAMLTFCDQLLKAASQEAS